jgi:tight adherence protein B
MLASLLMPVVFGLFFTSFSLATFVLVDALAPRRRASRPGEELPEHQTALLARAVELTRDAADRRGFVDALQAKIDQSGLTLRAGELIFFHVAAVIAIGLLASFATSNPVFVVLLVGLGAAAPLVGLELVRKRREARFHDQLPDTLVLIGGALKAGYSFLQAIDMVVQETLPPVSDEFKRVLAESQLGLPVEQALDHMAQRVNSTNFYWTVMAVKIQREVGGNLAEVLEILASTIRERDAVSRQIKTLTAEGRLSAIILYILPFVVAALLYVMNPGYLSVMFTTAPGIGMLVVAAIMLVVGGVWLKRVVTIEV